MEPVRACPIHRRLLGALLAISTLVIACDPPKPIRNLIWISLDTARADHFGAYGNPWVRTPNFDAFAGEALLFDDYMNVASSTLASHVSLFSGKYPHAHGTVGNGWLVDRSNRMLPVILRDHGFQTAGFPASFPLNSQLQFDEGFDFYDDGPRKDSPGLGPIPQGDDGVQRSAAEITDSVIRYLQGVDRSKPFFLFAHYFDPHRAGEDRYDEDYTPRAPEEFQKMYREGLSQAQVADERRFHESIAARPPTEEERDVARTYAAQITYLDRELGRLLDDLGARRLFDESLVVITSDHGEAFWDRDIPFNHASHTYQEVVRGVATVRFPDLRGANTRIGATVASIDLLPTVLSALGIDPPDDIDGIALPLFQGDDAIPTLVRFAEATAYASHETASTEPGDTWPNTLNQRAVREGRFKYMRTGYNGAEELYDLSADPYEARNLLEGRVEPEHRATADRLRRELERWTRTAPFANFNINRVDPEAREQLKELGYVR